MKGRKVRRVIEDFIDYKDAKKLQKFVTDQGKLSLEELLVLAQSNTES